MKLRNDGKCVVQFELKEVCVTLTIRYFGEKYNNERGSIGGDYGEKTFEIESLLGTEPFEGVIGINSQVNLYCGEIQLGGYTRQISDAANFSKFTYDYEISFVVKYGKKGGNTNDYSLNYTIGMNQSNDNFIQSIIKSDIIGY